MTEAVSLALIALLGLLLFAITVIILIRLVLKSKPASFKFLWNEFGSVEVNFSEYGDE